ncbi:MAG: coproporphyrinogen III oxidase, partial [Staphylococcus sp.]|nr:coproporphyrinogen III oxidase [Staphylococcus sp.]
RPILTSNFPTHSERMEEEMFLGLRMNKGVDKVKFLSKFGTSMDKVFGETINNLKKKNLLYERDNHISLTNKGKIIGNEVFEAFLLN